MRLAYCLVVAESQGQGSSTLQIITVTSRSPFCFLRTYCVTVHHRNHSFETMPDSASNDTSSTNLRRPKHRNTVLKIKHFRSFSHDISMCLSRVRCKRGDHSDTRSLSLARQRLGRSAKHFLAQKFASPERE